MKLKGVYFYFSFCLFALIACENATPKKGNLKAIKKTVLAKFPEPILESTRQLKIDAKDYYYDFLAQDEFNGQFLVAKNGRILFSHAEGFSNFRKKEVLTMKTPLHVASVSKVATAIAVLRLVDQGKIKLDADVRKYLPEFPYKKITVRMLMNHRSGIPYYGYFTYTTWHLGTTLNNSDVLRLLQKHKFPLNFPPNKKFAYSNTNYALLALIIERVTKMQFPKAMKTLVFDPLGMENSFILEGKKMYSNVSQSYKERHRIQDFDYLDAVYGDKNLFTTAEDLLKMDIGTYSPEFLSDSLEKQMFKGYSYERRGKSNYGLGIRLREMEGKDTYFFHTGWWHGNRACYASLRADTVCIIAITNTNAKGVYSISHLAQKVGNYPFDFEEN